MALTEEVIEKISEQLAKAEKACQPIDAISETYPDMTYDDAYGIQLKTIETKVQAGAVVVGRKTGLTSIAMQELIGLDEPDFVIIVDDYIVTGTCVSECLHKTPKEILVV